MSGTRVIYIITQMSTHPKLSSPVSESGRFAGLGSVHLSLECQCSLGSASIGQACSPWIHHLVFGHPFTALANFVRSQDTSTHAYSPEPKSIDSQDVDHLALAAPQTVISGHTCFIRDQNAPLLEPYLDHTFSNVIMGTLHILRFYPRSLLA
ncbi:hypothetical protein BV22DRAFT_1030544 [Leucogyrophana mollusca]|uniref:Uncharacterized protein n=1 Tax=Leucogyrophana mollusca TaxID=85980 RepID=A0ACB8BRL5_9AGAM|nr:hypothetical protein BV22DRAFT_1030544 [Leucogyrophana mollusca]